MLITILLYYRAHPIYENIEIALKRVPVYLFGLLYGHWSYESKIIAYKNIWIGSIIAVAYFVIEKIVPLSLIDRFDLSILAVLFAILLSDFLRKRIQTSQYRIIKGLGTISFELYLTHVALIWICIQKEIFLPNFALYIAMILISIVISVIVFYADEHIKKAFTK